MKSEGLRFGDTFCLTLLTSDPDIAVKAEDAGIDRIGIDVEHVGKRERQAGMDTRLSLHQLDDLSRIAPRVRRAKLFARLNPIHSETGFEIETALDLGANVLMLPHFRTEDEVACFVRSVRGRAQVAILVETAPAVTRIRQILSVGGVDEVTVGLNDLRLQLGVANPFEVLASPLFDMLAAEVTRAGLPLHVGGLGRAGDTALPVSADLIYAQYPRLGATGAWISRAFGAESLGALQMREEIRLTRERLSQWAESQPAALENARDGLAAAAGKWRLKVSGHTA